MQCVCCVGCLQGAQLVSVQTRKSCQHASECAYSCKGAAARQLLCLAEAEAELQSCSVKQTTSDWHVLSMGGCVCCIGCWSKGAQPGRCQWVLHRAAAAAHQWFIRSLMPQACHSMHHIVVGCTLCCHRYSAVMRKRWFVCCVFYSPAPMCGVSLVLLRPVQHNLFCCSGRWIAVSARVLLALATHNFWESDMGCSTRHS
jgi:hypothetical protein